jgi:hypothetical protein
VQKTRNILKDEGRRAANSENPDDLREEHATEATFLVCEAGLLPESRERLTWESPHQNVVWRYGVIFDLPNVSYHFCIPTDKASLVNFDAPVFCS